MNAPPRPTTADPTLNTSDPATPASGLMFRTWPATSVASWPSSAGNAETSGPHSDDESDHASGL